MRNKQCLIIAEAGVNHNGKLELAIELCNEAKNAGADVVKFQTWRTERLLTKTVEQAEYQLKNTGKHETQFEMLKRLELSYQSFCEIKKHCDDIGITFASTADEEESLDFLVNIGIPFVKVGSGDIGNVPFLRYIGRKNIPTILSTGMSTLEDVSLSLNALRQGGASDITLLHCTTDYPCPLEDVNLKAMLSLKSEFNLPVGFSDHTKGIEAAVAAVAMGACVIEKHFTLDCNMDGPDHLASTEPEQFKRMVDAIRNVEKCLGSGIKQPTNKERIVSRVVTKRIVAKKEITPGELFSEDNICIKRCNEGVLSREWDCVLGKKAIKNFKVDDPVVI